MLSRMFGKLFVPSVVLLVTWAEGVRALRWKQGEEAAKDEVTDVVEGSFFNNVEENNSDSVNLFEIYATFRY